MTNTPIAEKDLPAEEPRETDEETSWFERCSPRSVSARSPTCAS